MPKYIVRKITKGVGFMGLIHGADDDHKTLCGQRIDTWDALITDYRDGSITCKKCLEVSQ